MKTFSVPLFFVGFLLPSLGLAQEAQPQKDAKLPRKISVEAWKTVDRDKNGYISQEEYDGLPRVQKLPAAKRTEIFKRLDKNTDGQLSAEELNQLKDRKGPSDGPIKRLWELDTDRSHGLSFDEFKLSQVVSKLPPERQEALFGRLDADHDGVITPKDRPEAPPFMRPDKEFFPNREGHGAPRPHQVPKPDQVLKKLDTDVDGSISFAEFRLGPALKELGEDEQEQRFNKLDVDKNLKITLEELSADQSQPGSKPKP